MAYVEARKKKTEKNEGLGFTRFLEIIASLGTALGILGIPLSIWMLTDAFNANLGAIVLMVSLSSIVSSVALGVLTEISRSLSHLRK